MSDYLTNYCRNFKALENENADLAVFYEKRERNFGLD